WNNYYKGLSVINTSAFAFQHVVELHGQLAAEPLPKEELLCECKVFIQVSRRSQSVIERRCISNCPVSRKSERRGVNHRQPFVVIVPVDAEITGHTVRPVEHKNVANDGVAVELVEAGV